VQYTTHPPNGEDSGQDSSSERWPDAAQFHHHHPHHQQQQQQQHRQHQQQQQQQQQHIRMVNGNVNGGSVTPNGQAAGGGTPSPDFSGVSNSQISSSDNHHPTSGGRSSSRAGKNPNWKTNESRRPKTYKCEACNKWFTSSGHLKRHYNTTLHKNAVKQSGAADPATLPASAHHHPGRNGSNDALSRLANRRLRTSPPSNHSPPSNRQVTEYATAVQHASYAPSPNLMAGPAEVAPGGLHRQPLFTQSSPDLESPSPTTSLQLTQPSPILPPSNHTTFMSGFHGAAVTQVQPPPQHTLPFFHQSASTSMHPNYPPPTFLPQLKLPRSAMVT
jgi:hypothetical protein